MEQRKFKALLMMPLLVIPLIIFFAWILGIVGPVEASAQDSKLVQGINTSLPAAMPTEDSTWNKMNFYEQADRDSAKMRQLQRQDPYLNKNKRDDDLLKKYSAKNKYQPYPEGALNEPDEQEKKVYEQISQIHRELEKPAKKKTVRNNSPKREPAINEKEVDRLERMMEVMNNKEKEEDPEMQEINALMEKIMDVQHPERVKQRMMKEEIEPKVYEVHLNAQQNEVVEVATNRFYSLEETNTQTGIEAVVHETRNVGNGDIVKLRLNQHLFIQDKEIAANEFIYGQAKINGSRLLIHVPFIVVNGVSLPIALDVIGPDGVKGIPMNNAPASDAVNNAADKSVQGINLASLDNSLGAQVAGAMVQSGKSLIKKQVKAVKYTVPAGYAVHLQNVQ